MRHWGEAHGWRGADPYDALNSPFSPVLTLGTRFGRQVLTQAVKRSPINLRALLRIKAEWNAKAIGLVASAYAHLAAAGDTSAAAQANRWLAWLESNHSGDETGLAWGYPFDVQTRFFRYARYTPNTIATTFVAQAFLDGADLLGEDRWRAPADSAASFLVSRMLVRDGGGEYFRYVATENELVHNANALACAVLGRVGRGEEAARPLATTLNAQNADGSWRYAEGPHGNWIDNFHTGYVLQSIAQCVGVQSGIEERLTRGVEYWRRELFQEDATPRPSPGRTYPIDAHDYATAIDTWLAVSATQPHAREQARQLAQLLVDRMLDRRGFVWFQQHRYWTTKTPFVRWTTAPSFRALAALQAFDRLTDT